MIIINVFDDLFEILPDGSTIDRVNYTIMIAFNIIGVPLAAIRLFEPYVF